MKHSKLVYINQFLLHFIIQISMCMLCNPHIHNSAANLMFNACSETQKT